MLRNTSLQMTADSDFATAGKQFICRITGRSAKFTFERTFVGKKSGKRGDVTSIRIDEPGLYQIRDTSRKGTTDTYLLVWDDAGGVGLGSNEITEEHAMLLARALDAGTCDLLAEGVQVEIARQEGKIALGADKDPDEILTTKGEIGPLAIGPHRRGDILAARRAEIARLRGEVPSDRPLELDGAPSDPVHARRELETERSQLLTRLAEIDAALAGGAS